MTYDLFNITKKLFWFQFLGLCKKYKPKSQFKQTTYTLEESVGARIARRNNLALAAIVIVGFMAGADPQELELFGLKVDETRGVYIICGTTILLHFYWYCMRYIHLYDDSEFREYCESKSNDTQKILKIDDRMILNQETASLVKNWICFLLVSISIIFIFCWIHDELTHCYVTYLPICSIIN